MPKLAVKDTISNATLLSSPLPCLIVDRHGIISNASPAVNRLSVSAVNRPLAHAFGISQEELSVHLASGGDRLLVGESIDSDGRANPVLAQAFNLPKRQATLLILTDLGPWRRAEETRFDATPYPLLRLSHDGRILFSNSAAFRALEADISGRPLPEPGLSWRSAPARSST